MSLLAPVLRSEPEAAVVSWLRARPARLYLPVVSLAELASGIEKLRRTGSVKRAEAYDEWVEELVTEYADRIVLLDVAAATAAGRLTDKARALGRPTGFADLAIAGIAMANGLTLLTRNLRHFAPLGVPALDPYAALPE